MDKQDFYTGQIVNEGELDTVYTDAENAERNQAVEGNLGQVSPSDPTTGNANALRSGGITKGLVVTKNAAQAVNITAGTARDSLGRRIAIPDAVISISNLGSTPEGTITIATAIGNGSIAASSISAGEAWLSLFVAFDTNLSDNRIDSLSNPINYRHTESFHFEMQVGTDAAAPATARVNLADGRILLCDILLDNNGDIISLNDVVAPFNPIAVIATSTRSLAQVGLGPDDPANLTGRRSDWASIDYIDDPTAGLNTELTPWRDAVESGGPNGKAYYNIRTGDPRDLVRELAVRFGTGGDTTTVAGSELVGGKETTGSALSSPGAAAKLDLAALSSVHAQLVQLKDKVNTLLSRGTDTLTGDLTVTGDVNVQTDLNVTNNVDVTGNYSSAAGDITLFGGDLAVAGTATFQPAATGKKVSLDATGLITPVETLEQVVNLQDGIVEKVDAFGIRRHGRYAHYDFVPYTVQDWLTAGTVGDRYLLGSNGGGSPSITKGLLGTNLRFSTGAVDPSDVWMHTGGGFQTVDDGTALHFYARVVTGPSVSGLELFLGFADKATGGPLTLGVDPHIGFHFSNPVAAITDDWSVRTSDNSGGGAEANTAITVTPNTTYEMYFAFRTYSGAPTHQLNYWVTGMPSVLQSTVLAAFPAAGTPMFGLYVTHRNNVSAAGKYFDLCTAIAYDNDFTFVS